MEKINNIENCIGQKVNINDICHMTNGECLETVENGILCETIKNEYVFLETRGFPLIHYSGGVSKITLEDGTLIYYNPRIASGVIPKTIEGVLREQKIMYGSEEAIRISKRRANEIEWKNPFLAEEYKRKLKL